MPGAHLVRKELSRTSLKWVQATIFGGEEAVAKLCSVAQSRPTPSQVSVPLPNSSIIHSDLHTTDHLQTVHNTAHAFDYMSHSLVRIPFHGGWQQSRIVNITILYPIKL